MTTLPGAKGVLRWQAAGLVAGGIAACLGTSLVLFKTEPSPARTTGWWISGLATGALALALTFPIDTMGSPDDPV